MLTTSNRISNCICLSAAATLLVLISLISSGVAFQQGNEILLGGVPKLSSSISSTSSLAASIFADPDDRNSNKGFLNVQVDGLVEAWNNRIQPPKPALKEKKATTSTSTSTISPSASSTSSGLTTYLLDVVNSITTIGDEILSVSTTSTRRNWPQEDNVNVNINVTTQDPSLRQRKVKLAFGKLKNAVKQTIVPGYTPKNELELQREVDRALRQVEFQERQQQFQQKASNRDVWWSEPLQALEETTASQPFPFQSSAALQMVQTFTESVKSQIGGNLNLVQMEMIGSKTSSPSTPTTATAVLPIQSMKDSILSKLGAGSLGLTSEPQLEDGSKKATPPPPPENDDDKFSMAQRIESAKCVVAGALGGGIAVSPITYLHSALLASSNSLAQWELWTDMGSLQAALFAIVYRYAVRGDNNPMLNQGVIGAFVLARTLSAIQVSETCTAVPLTCK